MKHTILYIIIAFFGGIGVSLIWQYRRSVLKFIRKSKTFKIEDDE